MPAAFCPADEVSYLNRKPQDYFCDHRRCAVLTLSRDSAIEDDIVIRDMLWSPAKLIPRSAPVILLVLTLAAATGFAAVGHLVARFTANQQARGRKLYVQGQTAAAAARYDDAIAAFRAALTCDPSNSQYQLSLARALRDSDDPRRLEEAESYLLPAAQTRDKNAVNSVQMEQLCQQLRKEFDFVIIDSPAGIEQGFRNAIVGADEIIIVANPEMASVRDANRIIGLVEAADKPEPRLILTRLRSDMVRRGDMMDVADVLKVPGY